MSEKTKLSEMSPEERAAVHKEQTTEQYAAIGRFVVEFEQCCGWLRTAITFALHRDGLRTQNLAHILLDNPFMTAKPLIDAFDAIMNETGTREDTDQKEVLDQISKEFQYLIGQRNRVVHGRWFIGFAGSEDTDFSLAGMKGKPSKKAGMGFDSLATDIGELEQLADRAAELGALIQRLECLLQMNAAHGEKKYKVANNFTKVDGVWKPEKPNQ